MTEQALRVSPILLQNRDSSVWLEERGDLVWLIEERVTARGYTQRRVLYIFERSMFRAAAEFILGEFFGEL